MARSSQVRHAVRNLIWLAVVIGLLIAGTGAGVLFSGASWAPKLALDLQGGTQIVLTPQVNDAAVTEEQLKQAVAIIRQRVDASGVSEAEINTQGSNNVVVSIPGTPDKETLARIEASAKLDFRPVLTTSGPTNEIINADGTSSIVDPSSIDPNLPSTPTISPSNGSDINWVTPALAAQYQAFSCASEDNQDASAAPVDLPLITCDPGNTVKYLLGPVEVDGSDISDASSGVITTQTGASTGQWAVDIVFNAVGTKKFADTTTRLVGLTGAQNQFAIVLDGRVISAPSTQSAITNGKPQISGGFTQESAKTLADQLKYGALPIGFQVESSESISATLGTTQLVSGLIAGAIGLALVIVYSLIQYRTLGFVTILSLVVAAIITYFCITILSAQEGFRLSLSGVVGLIVAIGITADSFIVYFERVRDELREGRSLETAVDSGWSRAVRTILVSGAVNFLAALVLFILAVGNVRGFALTLGLATIVDIVVVMLFTHPLLQLLSRRNFFAGGHSLSGLNPVSLNAVYQGRGRFRVASGTGVKETKIKSASREAAKRQTIAERKAAVEAGERGED